VLSSTLVTPLLFKLGELFVGGSQGNNIGGHAAVGSRTGCDVESVVFLARVTMVGNDVLLASPIVRLIKSLIAMTRVVMSFCLSSV
jgi:hypothetical protein